jgi:hypothetical protein
MYGGVVALLVWLVHYVWLILVSLGVAHVCECMCADGTLLVSVCNTSPVSPQFAVPVIR